MEYHVQRLSLRDAFLFGIEGSEGAWQRLTREHEEMKNTIKLHEAFRIKAALLVTLGGGVLGLISGIIAVIVEHSLH